MIDNQTIVRIALDDYIDALSGLVKETTIGEVRDQLSRRIPNMLKDEKLRVRYDEKNESQHVYINNPKHQIKVIRVTEEGLINDK